jgi:hypothetical protein
MLTGVHIDWSAPPLSNLTKLELKYQAADVMPTVAHFIQILAESPNLEVLAIVGRGPQFATSEGVGSSTVLHGGSAQADARALHGTIKLARVTQFTFGFVDVNYAVQLLSLFDLPALCELSLEDVSTSLRHQPPDDADVLLDWLANAADSADSHDSPILQAVLDNAVESRSASTSRLPLGQLHTLALHSIYAPRPTFARLYDACTELGVLRLCDVCDGALEALQAEVVKEMPSANSNPMQSDVLPHLNTLFARGVDKEIFTRVVSRRGTVLKDTRFEEPGFDEYADDD